jgi:hypothetical protein
VTVKAVFFPVVQKMLYPEAGIKRNIVEVKNKLILQRPVLYKDNVDSQEILENANYSLDNNKRNDKNER